MKKIILALLIFASCNNKPADQSKQAAEEIRKTDIAMSDLATKEGFFKSLLTYAEDSMIIPRDGKLPLMSKAEATTSWADKPVIKEITWEPIRVVASESGDMGYSFGYSTYKGKDTTTYTNYTTVWHKQKDGSWKFVLDGGNSIPNPWSK